jgi:hypothetical protein
MRFLVNQVAGYCILHHVVPTSGVIMPSQQADDSTVYALSPARCPSSTPNSAIPQTFHNSPINAHHNSTLPASAGDASSRPYGELTRGMIPPGPFTIDVKDQISDLPNANAFPSLPESAPPKKKRRRRKKADPATGDVSVVSSCGAAMSSGSDHELNTSLFMSQFAGGNLGLLLFVGLEMTLRQLMLPVVLDASYINVASSFSFPYYSRLHCRISNYLLSVCESWLHVISLACYCAAVFLHQLLLTQCCTFCVLAYPFFEMQYKALITICIFCDTIWYMLAKKHVNFCTFLPVFI